MSNTINIKPEYIYITVPAEYIGIYHAILTIMADYGEDMLLDCKATCKERNYNVVDCFNMFNAAIAARALHKTKLEETLIKYIKAKIQQIYKNTDKKVTFECVINEDIYKEVYAIQNNTTIFKIDLANITNNITKHIVNKSEWSNVITPQLSPNTVTLGGGTINLQGKVKRTIEYEWSDDRENTFETEELTLKWKVKINDGSYTNIVGNLYGIDSSTTNRDFYFIGYTDSLLGDNYTTSSLKVEQKNNDNPSTPDEPTPLEIPIIYGSISLDSINNVKNDIINGIKNNTINYEEEYNLMIHDSNHNNLIEITMVNSRYSCVYVLLPIDLYPNKTIIHCTQGFGDETITNAGGLYNIDGEEVQIEDISYKLYAFVDKALIGDNKFAIGLI